MKNIFKKLALALLLTLLAVPASAAPFAIFDTGVDNAMAALPDNTIDTHYTVSGPVTGTTTTPSVPIPSPQWIPDSATSRWISPNPDLLGPDGIYVYATTFDLTGYTGNGMITGQWAADNSGVSILLNGSATGITGGSFPSPGFGSYTAFAIDNTANFNYGGMNTLTFSVGQSGGFQTGLRVDGISGSANLQVPELDANSAGTTLAIVFCLFLGLADRRRASRTA